MSAARRAIADLDVGLRRVTAESERAGLALGSLYTKLGMEDEDVAALDEILSSWHEMHLRLADSVSANVRRQRAQDN